MFSTEKLCKYEFMKRFLIFFPQDSSLGTPNSSPGSAPSLSDSFNSQHNSNQGRERKDKESSNFGAKVSDFEATVSNNGSSIVDNESVTGSSTVGNSSMNVSSDETETMTDREDSSTEEGEEEEEEEEESDGDTPSGIQSTSESMLQSSEEGSSSSDHVGLKQPAVFLTQIMGDFKQKQSHITTHTAGSGSGQPSGETEMVGDSRGVIQAVKDGDLGKLRELLKGRQRLNVTDSNRRTPLHIACSLGRQEMVQLFVKIGMNVDACSIVGQTPLHETCIGGHYGILKMLISEVADLDAVDHNGLSAAHYCALNGEVRCLDLLCEQVN